MDAIHKLALETIQLDKQAIVFCPSRASAEKTAEDISKLTNLNLQELEKNVLKAGSTPTKQCRKLSHCVNKGIAFHHAGLLQKQKELIEDNFRGGTVKVICATPTLAAGLSLPAYRVVIKSLKRYSGRWGMDWIPVLEYLQMAGRAGRPEYEKEGQAIAIAKNESEKDEIYETYVLGEPEEIYSKLAVEPVLRTYLLSLISSGIIRDEKTMLEFFSKTFWAHQFGDMPKLELIMNKMLSLLEEWEFVKISGGDDTDNDFVSAANLEKPQEKRMRATLVGKRVSELYLDPLTAKHLIDCLMNYKTNSENSSFPILQMICNTLEMRPLLRIKVKQQDHIQEELNKNYHLLLKDEPSAYDIEYPEFMNSIKTTLFFESWIDEKDEDFLLEKYDIRPGEIRYKLDAADWLLYASEELSKILMLREAGKETRKLRIRVKQGVREELLNLIKLKGIGRVRARKLHTHGIKEIKDVKGTDFTSLSQLLGTKLATDVKKQVGEEVKEIKKGTRKGQLSIKKF